MAKFALLLMTAFVEPAQAVIPLVDSGCPTTTLLFANNAQQPIPAGPAVITSTITVSGAGPFLWDLDVTTFITHSGCADLDITLISPAGTVVTLTTDNGGLANNVFNGTMWDDQANPGGQVPYPVDVNEGLAADQTYINGFVANPLVPEEAFGAFLNENPNGVWTLTISDDAPIDAGNLTSWSMAVTTLPALIGSGTAGIISQDVPKVISTGAPPNVVTSTLTFGAVPGSRVCDIVLGVFITHTLNADLDITLTHANTVVTITTDNGGGNDNVFNGTFFGDNRDPDGQVPYSANDGLVTDHAYVNNTVVTNLVPEEALSAFLGKNPDGVWTLTISDDSIGNGGSLDGWGLTITTCIPSDPDIDGVTCDNCPFESNANQSDADVDGKGDVCDNCPTVSNINQIDFDMDGVGTACDNCLSAANANQADADDDGAGDVCDACPNDAANDADTDGVCGDVDNCPSTVNSDQADADGDGKGDACDNCPDVFNADQADSDADGVGDACPPPPPPDEACGTCAQGVLPATLVSLSVLLLDHRRRKQRSRSCWSAFNED